MTGRCIKAAIFVSACFATASATAAPPVEWDGLQRVQAKRFALVYIQPGADFRQYTKVMIEPTEVAFQKNWRRDYNSSVRDLGAKVLDRDIQDAVAKGVEAASDLFTQAWRNGGYEVVQSPGPDVLKVRTAIVNITVSSPDVRSSSRSYSFSKEAGQASLVIELRDSLTGALIGRAVDRKIAGDNTVGWRSSVSNRADFRQIVKEWAEDSVRGMNELKKASHSR